MGLSISAECSYDFRERNGVGEGVAVGGVSADGVTSVGSRAQPDKIRIAITKVVR